MGHQPDYSEYSLEELYDAYSHVDRNEYPERAQQIKEEIDKRQAVHEDPKQKTEVTKSGSGIRPIIITILCWFIIITSALAIIVSFLPFISSRYETISQDFFGRSKWISFVYSFLINAVAITGMVALLKGLAWSRPVLVAYFVSTTILNWFIHHYFHWVSLLMFMLYIGILFLPITTNYLKGDKIELADDN